MEDSEIFNKESIIELLKKNQIVEFLSNPENQTISITIYIPKKRSFFT